MPNTNCSPSCNAINRTRTVRILGKEVIVKNYICSADGVHYKKKPQNVQLQLSVCPTSYCSGGCPFCIAKDIKSRRKLDIGKFANVMRLLKAEDRIRGVKITGGEPFYDIGLLNEVVSVLYEIFGHELELSISTNGIWLDQLHKIKGLAYIEAIHISRHHYNDDINQSLFGGVNVPSGDKLKEIVSLFTGKQVTKDLQLYAVKGLYQFPKGSPSIPGFHNQNRRSESGLYDLHPNQRFCQTTVHPL